MFSEFKYQYNKPIWKICHNTKTNLQDAQSGIHILINTVETHHSTIPNIYVPRKLETYTTIWSTWAFFAIMHY